jgi:hypothetical protein
MDNEFCILDIKKYLKYNSKPLSLNSNLPSMFNIAFLGKTIYYKTNKSFFHKISFYRFIAAPLLDYRPFKFIIYKI